MPSGFTACANMAGELSPPPLPQHARLVLAHIALLVRQGFTGRIEIDLNQGGIRDFREIKSWKKAELSDGPCEVED